MDIQFQFYLPERYSRLDLMEFNKVYVRKSKFRRCWRAAFRTVSALAGAALVIGGLMILLLGGIEEGLLVPGVVSTVLGLVLLLTGIFYYRINAWGSRRQMLRETGSFIITLYEDGVTEETEKGTTRYPYASFTDIVFRRDRWFLFLDPRHALILPLCAMTLGAPAELDRFLTERAGNQIQKYK